MPTVLLRCALFALPLLPLVPLEAAYNPAIVSADARWIVFADLDALRSSTLGKEFIAAIEKEQAQATGGTIGLDIPKVLRTVGSLTAYGTNLSKDPKAIDGALIAQGTAELRKITESILLQGTIGQPEVFSEVTDLPFPAYAISNPKAPEAERMQLVVAFPPEPIVVISKSKAQLVKACAVFRGAAPSLAKSGASPLAHLAATAEGAYFLATSAVPTEPLFAASGPQARILQLANSGAIAFGENGPDTFVHAELVASSDTSAEKLMKILQGLTAMLSLAETNDRQLADFLNSTAVSRDRDTVTLHLAYPSARLVQMTQAIRAKAEAHPANRPPMIVAGKSLAEWGGEGAAAAATGELEWRTIEGVTLTNGMMISLGRANNGGKGARFDRLEVIAADGTGSPLVFHTNKNTRGNVQQFTFPGVDGTYTLKVAYQPDPEGKAKFAVSVRDPNEPARDTAPAHSPIIPQPKAR